MTVPTLPRPRSTVRRQAGCWLLAAVLVLAARLTGWTWAFGLASVVPALLGLKRWIFWSVEE